jgi:hypothetical protein
MLRRLAILAVLAFSPAKAQEANLSTLPEAMPGAASQLVLAERVYREATRTGDPVLLLSAIRLARGVTQRCRRS